MSTFLKRAAGSLLLFGLVALLVLGILGLAQQPASPQGGAGTVTEVEVARFIESFSWSVVTHTIQVQICYKALNKDGTSVTVPGSTYVVEIKPDFNRDEAPTLKDAKGVHDIPIEDAVLLHILLDKIGMTLGDQLPVWEESSPESPASPDPKSPKSDPNRAKL